MHRIHPGKLSILFVAVVLLLILATFTTLAYLGDLNLDDLVNSSDIAILLQSFGTDQNDPGFNRFADLNLDDDVDVHDLAIAGRSYGSTFNFHYPHRISNSNRTLFYVDTCIDASDRIHIAWSEDDYVFYTRLDRYGNTLVDDLLLDHHNYSGSNGVGIGCDDAGNSHIVWDCYIIDDRTCQARIDQYGYLRYVNYMDMNQSLIGGFPGVDLDSQERAHILYEQSYATNYAMVNPDGVLQALQQIFPTSNRYHDLAVDSQDAVHLLYTVAEGDDRVVYQRFGYGDTPSIGETNLGSFLGFSNYSPRASLALDHDDNVFALFNPVPPGKLYLEKLDASGTSVIDDKELFEEYDVYAYNSTHSDIAVDSLGNLHLVSFTDFKPTSTSGVHLAYGTFDNDAGVLEPMRWAIYGYPPSYTRLLLDAQDDASLIYIAQDQTGYPPCPVGKLCYQGTAFDAGAYNRSLPDLGIDVAHFSWEPLTIRWEQPFVITGTVFNAGWYTSTETPLAVSIELTTGVYLEEPFPLKIFIPGLSPNQTHQFSTTVNMPYSPGPGYEALRFARLWIKVDPDEEILETTEENNLISSPILIQPLPTQTGLYLVIRDDTYTVWPGGEGVYINTGAAAIDGPGYSKEMEVTEYATTLADDLPIDAITTTYTIKWQGEGYRSVDDVEIEVRRNPSDPYLVDFSPDPPGNVAVMVTDRWGWLKGTISVSGGGGLAGAKVRIVGQGLSIETTTDTSGRYRPDDEPALGQMIPGDYQIRISAAGYARVIDTISIANLEQKAYNQTLNTTTVAYVHGNLINEFGNPVAGALVNACGVTRTTGSDGVFDMEVLASCDTLLASKTNYDTVTQEGLVLTAGLEYLFPDWEMGFNPDMTIVSAGDKVASRIIDATTGSILPDAPDDAGFALSKLYDQFKKKFWIDYRILVLYGCYQYNVSAAISGYPSDTHLKFVEVNLAPKTFEVHMSLGSVNFLGATIPIPIVSDSGLRSALYTAEVRLVNKNTGDVIHTIYAPTGGASEEVIDDTTLTFDFGTAGEHISDWTNTEVWVYLKTGINDGGSFDYSSLLYQFDQQILKLDLDTGTIFGSYELGVFPDL